MIKKGAKLIMILIMLLGMSFTILNFLSTDAETIPGYGHYVIDGSDVDCYPPGSECVVGSFPRG